MSKRGSYCTQMFCKGRDLLDSELFSFDPNKTTHKLTATTTAKWRRSSNKGYLSSFNHCFQPAQNFRSVGENDRIKYYLLSNITLQAESSPIFLRNIEEDSARTKLARVKCRSFAVSPRFLPAVAKETRRARQWESTRL